MRAIILMKWYNELIRQRSVNVNGFIQLNKKQLKTLVELFMDKDKNTNE